MRTVRFILAALVIMAVSAPAWAICGYCDSELNRCVLTAPPDSCHVVRNQDETIYCEDVSGYCTLGARSQSASQEWSLVSIETTEASVVTNASQVRPAAPPATVASSANRSTR